MHRISTAKLSNHLRTQVYPQHASGQVQCVSYVHTQNTPVQHTVGATTTDHPVCPLGKHTSGHERAIPGGRWHTVLLITLTAQLEYSDNWSNAVLGDKFASWNGHW